MAEPNAGAHGVNVCAVATWCDALRRVSMCACAARGCSKTRAPRPCTLPIGCLAGCQPLVPCLPPRDPDLLRESSIDLKKISFHPARENICACPGPQHHPHPWPPSPIANDVTAGSVLRRRGGAKLPKVVLIPRGGSSGIPVAATGALAWVEVGWVGWLQHRRGDVPMDGW